MNVSEWGRSIRIFNVLSCGMSSSVCGLSRKSINTNNKLSLTKLWVNNARKVIRKTRKACWFWNEIHATAAQNTRNLVNLETFHLPTHDLIFKIVSTSSWADDCYVLVMMGHDMNHHATWVNKIGLRERKRSFSWRIMSTVVHRDSYSNKIFQSFR